MFGNFSAKIIIINLNTSCKPDWFAGVTNNNDSPNNFYVTDRPVFVIFNKIVDVDSLIGVMPPITLPLERQFGVNYQKSSFVTSHLHDYSHYNTRKHRLDKVLPIGNLYPVL
jgi:hypothetical protein